MKQTLVLILAMTLLFACRQKTAVTGEKIDEQTSERTDTIEQTNEKIAVEPETTLATGKTCYQYIKGKDNAKLSLKIEGKKASGDLAYSWFQKDKNTGTINGEMRGDTLIANYTFASEGKQSVREVVFLKKGDRLLEGVGEVTLDGPRTLFADRSKLVFGESVVFSRVACK